MKTLLISTAIIAVMSVWSGAETIPFCKDVPAYTDCQSPNGSGGWTMVMYHLTEKERVYLRKADKLTELQRQNTEAIKKAVGAEPEIKISTESGHIYAEANGKKIEVPKIAWCQAFGHRFFDANDPGMVDISFRPNPFSVNGHQGLPIETVRRYNQRCLICNKRRRKIQQVIKEHWEEEVIER